MPAPSASGIDHVVVLMMENRSFDHYLGWLPGSDGRQAGLQYPDPAGQLHATYHLATYQGCGYNDPDHSYQGGRVELNGGKCDGWLLDTANDIFCIGYYQASDLAWQCRAVLDDVRSLLRRDDGTHLPEPVLHARRANRPDRRHLNRIDAADHLGFPGGGGHQPHVLLLGCSVHGAVGRKVRFDL
jgi:hypothetical protein